MMGSIAARIKEKFKKEVASKLQTKLTLTVLLTVAVMFVVILFFSVNYYQNYYWEREISNHRQQMDKVVAGLLSVQTTTKNISKQLVVSDAVQRDIPSQESGIAKRFIMRQNIRKALGTYTHILDNVQEIMIYTKEGRTYSSIELRDAFQPEEESWYLDFKKTGQQKGYTGVHLSAATQNNRYSKVFSYVLTYFSVSDYHKELGDLVINLDYNSLEEQARMDMALLEGYAIYDWSGNPFVENGTIGMSYEELLESGKDQLVDSEGNVYLISRELDGGWIMVTEISGRLIQSQVRSMIWFLVMAFLVLVVLIVLVLSYNIGRAVEPIKQLSAATEQLGTGNFEVSVAVKTGDEVEILANGFNQMVGDLRHYMEMSVEHEKIIRRSQVDQLLLQINPHFMYNTLNSIVYMARMEGNKDIEIFVNEFISLLQSSLYVDGSVFISLEEELKNVDNYLTLQKYRYVDQFEAEIVCREEWKQYQVPRVILQPIVENAIFHGIAPMEGKGKLRIMVKVEERHLQVVVADNGIGMSEEMIQALYHEEHGNRSSMRKIGTANVYRRIKEICGEEYGFTVESEEGWGTRVTIHLPLISEAGKGKQDE